MFLRAVFDMDSQGGGDPGKCDGGNPNGEGALWKFVLRNALAREILKERENMAARFY
jgi:hypothetical protein